MDKHVLSDELGKGKTDSSESNGVDDTRQSVDTGLLDNNHTVEIFVEEHKVDENDAVQTQDLYKKKLSHTICVCGSRFVMGWLIGLIGPTFPDLRLVINKDLTTASWIFTTISLGCLVGSVLGSLIYSKCPKTVYFICVTLGLGLASAVMPWCSHFAAMLTTSFILGSLQGSLDTVSATDVVLIWGSESGPYMQAIHGVCSLGGIVAPFAADPFLAKPRKLELINTETVAENLSHFESHVYLENSTEVGLATNEIQNNIADFAVFDKTKIYIPYLMVTAMALIITIMFVVSILLFGNVYKTKLKNFSASKDYTTQRPQYLLNSSFRAVFIFLLVLVMVFYGMGERGFIAFLTTFLISHQNWSKSAGSNASAAFWIAFTFGRLSAVIIVRHVRTLTALILYLSCLALGGTLLYISVKLGVDQLIWVSVALVGLGMSALFALLNSWVGENICQLTGKIVTLLFLSNFIGAMTFPLLEGYLMDRVSQMYFVYSQMAVFFAMAVIFFCVAFAYALIAKSYHK